MKIDECILDIDKVVVSETEYFGQEPEWKEALDLNIIPANLYRFYCKADYFFFGKAPLFLSDSEKLLFPFLEAMCRGIRNSFMEANELATKIGELHPDKYSPIKRMTNQPWNETADRDTDRSFKYLVVNLTGALDQFAEIAALLLYPTLTTVPPGRASFVALSSFLTKLRKRTESIISPQEHFAEDLKVKMLPLIEKSGTDKNWIELLHLYRNKLAHLGSSAFQYMCLHDKAGEFYLFLPKMWPRFFKQDVKEVVSTLPPTSSRSMVLTAKSQLIHCDLVEYSQGITQAVRGLLDAGMGVICEVYDSLKTSAPNQPAADALMKQRQEFEFQHF